MSELLPEVDISVVLITCNRVGMLRTALESVLAQAMPRPEWTFEVIVVDDGSKDETQAVLEAMVSRSEHPLRLVRTEGVGIPAARNLGAKTARGRWIVSFDDDQIAGAGWLCSFREAAEKTRAGCFGGALTLLLPEGVSGMALGPRARAVLGEHLLMTTLRPYPAGFLPATNNAMVDRELFEKIGGFDVSFRQGGSDTDFFERVERSGETIWFVPAASAQHVMTPHRLTEGNLRWTCRKIAAARVQILLKMNGPFAVVNLLLRRAAVTLLRDWPQLLAARLSGNAGSALDARCSLWFNLGVLQSFLARAVPRWKEQHQNALNFRSRNGERMERV
jgi:GT2 family glycosyltransferase